MARRSAGFVSKKPHRKSRGGCTTCKKKKVKCDETQPACGYCSARKYRCEYPQDPQSHSKSLSHSSDPDMSLSDISHDEVNFNDSAVQIPTWVSPPRASSAAGELSLLDHELLHHYKTKTWRTFAVRDDPAIHNIHKNFVPQTSISHPYLFYAILAIAADHSNTVRPSKAVENQQLVYRSRTFHEYNKALQNITTENYESILVTGTFLLALMPPPMPWQGDKDHFDWMFGLLKLSEGLRILASLRWSQGIEKLTIYPLICRELRTLPPSPTTHGEAGEGLHTPVGPLGTTPVNPNPPSTYHQQHPLSAGIFLPPPLMALYQSLVSPVETSGPMDLNRQTLLPVFHALSPIFLSLYYYHLNQDFYVRVFVFPSFLMPEFMHLVKIREPRALTLVCWWFSMADLVPKGWWARRCVDRVIGAVGRLLRGQNRDGSKISGSEGLTEVLEKAFQGAEKIVGSWDHGGRDAAAMCTFEDWEGVNWEDGPKRAEEWEFEQLVDLADEGGSPTPGFLIPNAGA